MRFIALAFLLAASSVAAPSTPGTEVRQLVEKAVAAINSLDPGSGRAAALEALALVPEESVDRARTLDALGVMELNAGESESGEARIAEAVRLADRLLGEKSEEAALYRTNLALSLILRRQFGRAEPLLRSARQTLEAGGNALNPRLAVVYGELGSLYTGLKKNSLAAQYSERALAILERQPQPDPLVVALSRMNLGGIYLQSGKLPEAERLMQSAVDIERQLAPGSRPLAYATRQLAELRVAQRNWDAATRLYRESIELYEVSLGARHPELGPVLKAYADALRRASGRKEEIRSLEARARSLETQQPAS